jgi:hypothetical protein
MASNLTIESPNLDKIDKEAGQFTSDAINTLWASLNYAMKQERSDFRLVRDMIQPKVKMVAAAASVDNLDLEDSSVVEFTGGSAQNFTGMRAPETGRTRWVFVYVSGAGTITLKHNVTSESQNRLFNSSGADVALATGAGALYVYLSGLWRKGF